MANIFENLKLLKQDMISKKWSIDSFYFNFKNQTYIILVRLFERNERTPEYALVELEFLQENNFANNLKIYANSAKLFVEARTLREYFKIEYSPNLGDILNQFNQNFAEFIPNKVTDNKTRNQENAMYASLSKNDPTDPRKVYCYAVKRNPKNEDGSLGQRSSFNDNKTRLRRKSLYQRLGSDTNLSFCYSIDSDDEKTDEEIISNWTKNQNK